MSSTVSEATEAQQYGSLTAPHPIEVAWLGTRPTWLESEAGVAALTGFTVSSTIGPGTRVVHLGQGAAETVSHVRASKDDAAVVVDLGRASSLPGAALVDAAKADVALVDSETDARDARARVSELDGKLRVHPGALDLDWHAPESELEKLKGAHIKRFRRLHRLAHPTLLFVGPYTTAGGLDIAIAAAYRLREELEDLRLAAIPQGATDQKYLNRCEMDALALGHRGIVEWTCSPDDRRYWYATATVVCCPWREPGEAPEAPILAAIAARPFCGSDLAVFRDSFRAPDTPPLVPPGDVDALVLAVKPLLADVEAANVYGLRARSAAEAEFSFRAAGDRLATVWSALAGRSPLNQAA